MYTDDPSLVALPVAALKGGPGASRQGGDVQCHQGHLLRGYHGLEAWSGRRSIKRARATEDGMQNGHILRGALLLSVA